MANLDQVKSKPVILTLSDGVERTVRFTLNAMAELEDKYGSIEAAFAALESNSIKAVRFILWTGLMHSDENLTEMQVGNLIDMQYLNGLQDTLGTAFGNDLPSTGEIASSVELPDSLSPNK